MKDNRQSSVRPGRDLNQVSPEHTCTPLLPLRRNSSAGIVARLRAEKLELSRFESPQKHNIIFFKAARPPPGPTKPLIQ